MKTILLTGANGMVGKNVLSHANAKSFKWLTPGRKELNLTDQFVVENFIKKYQPDFIIHAAGLVGGIQANISVPVDFLVNNMRIGMNVLHGAMLAGIPNVLNLGSSCMYPRYARNPLKEELVLAGELEPTNEGYAIAKAAAARLCQYISQQSPDLAYKTAIPCNLYGRYDHFEAHRSHMIPAVIDKLHKAKQSQSEQVDIWGDGLSRREFMYAHDLADFVFYAINNFLAMPTILNVGLGKDVLINDYYKAIAEAVGYKGGFTHDLSKPSGMRQKLVDTSKLQDFGWNAPTSLKQGIEKTYTYYLELQA
jgi:GDP-L-fucose synthase